MTLNIRLSLRDWDYITPIVVGDVTSPRLTLDIERVGTLTMQVAFDGAEISFSRYCEQRFNGDDSLVGVPNFIMRGFRHRCIITAKNSSVRSLADLAGKNIGVTGWRDSGTVWTRAAARREGVGIEDAMWYAGRLTEAHPVTDRLGGYGRPGRIEAAPGERPMVELLQAGELDAVFTPFMPKGFFDKDSLLRPVLDDYRAAEVAYFKAVGYVPGMHLIGLKAELVSKHPWIVDEVSRMLDESKRLWLEKREKYADTTPWIIDELRRCSADLLPTWNDSGLSANEAMIRDFASELYEQKILPRLLSPTELFAVQS
ncbi:4,5-dihydroxyphthalate decarboxylase [Rhizobium aquaticum]|uniref:4,5-dihydroxyphthalate decarboxylase n=1 Tax=Rhizobium aquaticum TaxID=1549636 RepID=A0ABV2J6F0_9HYPH